MTARPADGAPEQVTVGSLLRQYTDRIAALEAAGDKLAEALAWSNRCHKDALAGRPHVADECIACAEAALAERGADEPAGDRT